MTTFVYKRTISYTDLHVRLWHVQVRIRDNPFTYRSSGSLVQQREGTAHYNEAALLELTMDSFSLKH